ncbi:uncharacterized protein LOC119679091 [Teleopsis dalmanni]|uniref:uncharacterized protein LOC119679091 n=1 Tax=Teleopsis dalmanni TaxID=139649 RepID=UPI000D32939A|nr:uncharacterized protein LOC119679091 [Teleopsis dalmanni]
MARTLEINAQRQRVEEDMEILADSFGLILINVSKGRLDFYCDTCREKFENVDNFSEHVIKEHDHELQEPETKTLHDDKCIVLSSESDEDEEKVHKKIKNARDPLGTNGKVQRLQQGENELITLSSESDMDVEEIRDEINNERESLEINDKVEEVQQCVQFVDAIPVDQDGRVNRAFRVQARKLYSRLNNTHYVNEVVGSNARIHPELDNTLNENVTSFTRLIQIAHEMWKKDVEGDGSNRESNASQIVGTNHQGTQDDLVQRVERNIFKNSTDKV